MYRLSGSLPRRRRISKRKQRRRPRLFGRQRHLQRRPGQKRPQSLSQTVKESKQTVSKKRKAMKERLSKLFPRPPNQSSPSRHLLQKKGRVRRLLSRMKPRNPKVMRRERNTGGGKILPRVMVRLNGPPWNITVLSSRRLTSHCPRT
jgi:hypothetical protein